MDLAGLPPELLLMVTAYLTHTDLKLFSQASKFCRSICLPALFHGVYIDTNTPSSFAPGGSLYHIRSHVKHISLDAAQRISFNGCTQEVDRTVDYIRICAQGLRYFPNLGSLLVIARSLEGKYLDVKELKGIQKQLIWALFSTISATRVEDKEDAIGRGVLDKVEELEFTFIDEGGDYEDDDGKALLEWDIGCLSEENRRFLQLGEHGLREDLPIQFPSGLSVRDAQLNFFTLAKFPCPDYFFNPFWTLQGSTETLTKLALCGEFGAQHELTMGIGPGGGTSEKPVLFALPQAVTFPNVRELFVTRQYMYPVFFSEICWRCPNVELLKVVVTEHDLCHLTLDSVEEMYIAIKDMKRLKFFIVPGPNLELEENLGPEELVAMWERAMEGWVEGGMHALEQTIFVMRSLEPDEFGWRIGGVSVDVIKEYREPTNQVVYRLNFSKIPRMTLEGFTYQG
ncbi:hypothetical protein TWF730_008794 [Orbilia blumenaviensis]|uniref:F-box domain-containing protein n=1 Tax=Orbilia blumenaviensis TaxID=1796055 RepID=A0AAV9V3D5_9PEZI